MTKLLQWPVDGMPSATELVRPVVDAIRRSHDVRFNGTSAKYTGYEIGESELATSFSPSELTVRELRRGDESPLFRLVLVAFQLGIEQGRRLERKEQGDWKELYFDIKEAKKRASGKIRIGCNSSRWRW
jgi:hypothetical protein